MLAGVLVLTGCDSGSSTQNEASQNHHSEPSADLEPSAHPEPFGEITGDISLALEPAQLDWVGQKIFENECAAQFQCLVHWNEGEAFPSLGIGHFIWYPKGVEEGFVESFPALIRYMEQRQLTIPQWLRQLEPFDAPWPDRDAFLSGLDSPEMAELREFLAGSQGVQAEFIFRRAKTSLADIVDAAPDSEQNLIRRRIQALSQTPGGVYAIMDYVNFKGEGLSPTEQYKGQGWGLLQVLQAMNLEPEATRSGKTAGGNESRGQRLLADFRSAAGEVLTRRANNADNPIERERWLPGWLRRLETYREPVDMAPVPGESG
jgi:hypothetical protein